MLPVSVTGRFAKSAQTSNLTPNGIGNNIPIPKKIRSEPVDLLDL